MTARELKVLRLLDPQGEPDIVECDGRRYLKRDRFEPRWFEGDYLCSRCYGYVGRDDAFCRTCGAARRMEGEELPKAASEVCQRAANDGPSEALSYARRNAVLSAAILACRRAAGK